MKKMGSVIGTIAQYAFIMILLNMAIVLLTLISFGLLAPLAICIAFGLLNKMISKERLSIKTINLKSGGILTLISAFEVIVIFQYIKVFAYIPLLSFSTLFYIAFGLICVYFYMFNTYFMFLATKNIDLKEMLLLSIIAPFHSIKQLLMLIVMLFVSIIVLLKFPSLLLLIGVALLLVLNNIILESYYISIKE